VVDGTGLENRHTRKGIGGSNPSLSAMFGPLHIDYFFWADEAKFLILPDLPDIDILESRQNIADKRLTCKIFQNRELAAFKRWDFAIAATSPLLSRTVPLCALCILGQGCSSQAMDFFLWKVVEKDCTGGKREQAGRFLIKNGERPVSKFPCPRFPKFRSGCLLRRTWRSRSVGLRFEPAKHGPASVVAPQRWASCDLSRRCPFDKNQRS
jgi:hypothetical protein